ncbi:MAG: DUF2334 domain-containing protein [Ruminococcaceae bacterium]|nr:DUF2334 domain-containing protein [Oscillospiraceae bacterium]
MVTLQVVYLDRKGQVMKRIFAFLFGLILLSNGIGSTNAVLASDAAEMLNSISVEISIDGMTTQAELMNATSAQGVVTVIDTTKQTEQTKLIVATFRNGEMQQSETIHTGMLPAGITKFDFKIDHLNKVDCIKAFVVLKDSDEICCPEAVDSLEPAQVIVFKFDDLHSTVGTHVGKFDKALDFLRDQGIPGTAGVLGKWLEPAKVNPKKYLNQINTVKSWILDGHQLWIHGYDHAPGEFAALKEVPASSYEKQMEMIAVTYDLMSTVLHYNATCFGASFNQNNEDTITVLNQEFPEIQTVLFMHDTKNRLSAMNLSSESLCEIETQAGEVSSQLFLMRYEYVKELPYLVIQAHPDQWNEQSFKELGTIVKFLKSKNCVFMTPEQYQKFTSAYQK